MFLLAAAATVLRFKTTCSKESFSVFYVSFSLYNKTLYKVQFKFCFYVRAYVQSQTKLLLCKYIHRYNESSSKTIILSLNSMYH